jgi:hypothetical protein
MQPLRWPPLNISAPIGLPTSTGGSPPPSTSRFDRRRPRRKLAPAHQKLSEVHWPTATDGCILTASWRRKESPDRREFIKGAALGAAAFIGEPNGVADPQARIRARP